MSDRMPVSINLLSFADSEKRIYGAIEISEFARLSDSLLENSGIVDVKVIFNKEGRLPVIRGEIKTNLSLKCQACLNKLVWAIDRSFKLGLVASLNQADRLAGDCEPLILKGDKVSLNELVEDELLLALPDFPRHQYNCVEMTGANQDDDNFEQSNANNPFSILAELKSLETK